MTPFSNLSKKVTAFSHLVPQNIVCLIYLHLVGGQFYTLRSSKKFNHFAELIHSRDKSPSNLFTRRIICRNNILPDTFNFFFSHRNEFINGKIFKLYIKLAKILLLMKILEKLNSSKNEEFLD